MVNLYVMDLESLNDVHRNFLLLTHLAHLKYKAREARDTNRVALAEEYELSIRVNLTDLSSWARTVKFFNEKE